MPDKPETAKAKHFTAARFRAGDVLVIPPQSEAVEIEMATHKGCREVRTPKSVGAKVRKANKR